MSILISLALVFVLLALIGWVLRPFWGNPEASSSPSDRPGSVPPPVPDSLDDPFKIQQLIDLEYDYQTGKVSYEEYVRQKREIIGA